MPTVRCRAGPKGGPGGSRQSIGTLCPAVALSRGVGSLEFTEAGPPIAAPNVRGASSFFGLLGVRRGSPPAQRFPPLLSSSARQTVLPRPFPSPDVRLRKPRLRQLAWRPTRPPRAPPLLLGPPRARQSDGYGPRSFPHEPLIARRVRGRRRSA